MVLVSCEIGACKLFRCSRITSKYVDMKLLNMKLPKFKVKFSFLYKLELYTQKYIPYPGPSIHE